MPLFGYLAGAVAKGVLVVPQTGGRYVFWALFFDTF